MNNNIINEEINEIDETEVCENTGKSGKGFLKALAVAAVVGGVATYLYKTKDKREAKKIKRLRDKGYVIYRDGEVDSDTVNEVE